MSNFPAFSPVPAESLEAANEEIRRLKAALERLASMEAFEWPRAICPSRDAELLARIDFARDALKPKL